METKLQAITQRTREDPELRFTSLAHHLNEDFLKECFEELKRGKAPGIDGVTVREYEVNLEKNIENLVNRLKAKQYKPQPVIRVYIPKEDKTLRGLGIPSVEDKVVQMGIKKILEAIFEQEFIDVSFGFRPNRSCHDALDVVNKVIMTRPVNWVVDMDIEKFFDTIDHKQLMELLRRRIVDPSFLRIIGRFLRAGIMEDGNCSYPTMGTIQGGVITP